MFAKKTALPEAWTVRRPRWYLKDAEFLSEIGGALAMLGLFLMICVGGQRAAQEGETPDAFTANVFVGLLFLSYAMSVSGGCMAGLRLATAGGRRPSSFHSVGVMLIGLAIAHMFVGSIAWGVTRLILPLQMFFAWLAMSVGLSLLLVMRGRQKAAEAKAASVSRPVE